MKNKFNLVVYADDYIRTELNNLSLIGMIAVILAFKFKNYKNVTITAKMVTYGDQG